MRLFRVIRENDIIVKQLCRKTRKNSERYYRDVIIVRILVRLFNNIQG